MPSDEIDSSEVEELRRQIRLLRGELDELKLLLKSMTDSMNERVGILPAIDLRVKEMERAFWENPITKERGIFQDVREVGTFVRDVQLSWGLIKGAIAFLGLANISGWIALFYMR